MNEKTNRLPPREKRPPGLLLSEIPGLNEALAKAQQDQFRTRENSMLRLTYDLCGIKVRTMTVSDYVFLERIHSPFTNRIVPTQHDLAMFLWVLSPQFPEWCKSQWFGWLQPVAAFFHGRKVRNKFCKDMPKTSQPVVIKCFEYIDTMFYDSPPAVAGGRNSCLSYLTGWFDALQSEYHCTDDTVWNMGLPELFQRLNAIRQRQNPDAPTFNKGTDNVQLWVVRSLREGKFTQEELKSGQVKIPVHFLN